MDDRGLLNNYVKNGSRAAFAELTRRYLKLVYATCYRELRSREMAEDATQVVFLLLARKAHGLRHKSELAGWMFHTSRLVSKNALRLERGRVGRDRKVLEQVMETEERKIAEWQPIDSCLNEALEALGRSEREAILSRFFEDETFAETGAALSVSEEAARKRVNRALEKLRLYFAKHGITASVTAIAGLLGTNAVGPAPSATAAAIAQIASANATGHIAAGVIGAHIAHLLQGVQRTMLLTKLATVAAVVMVAAGGAYATYPLMVGSNHLKVAAIAGNNISVLAGDNIAPIALDAQADRVLKLNVIARARAKTLTADYSVVNHHSNGGTFYSVYHGKFMRPNYFRSDNWDVTGSDQIGKVNESSPHEITASDGKTAWHVKKDGTYTKKRAGTDRKFLKEVGDELGLFKFFVPSEMIVGVPEMKYKYVGVEKWGAILCDVLEMEEPDGGSKRFRSFGKIYFGPDHMERRLTFGAKSGDYAELVVNKVTLNAHLTKADFVFNKPAFATTLK